MRLIGGTWLSSVGDQQLATLRLYRDTSRWHYRIQYGTYTVTFDDFGKAKECIKKLGYAVPKTLQFADGIGKAERRQLWPDGKATNK